VVFWQCQLTAFSVLFQAPLHTWSHQVFFWFGLNGKGRKLHSLSSECVIVLLHMQSSKCMHVMIITWHTTCTHKCVHPHIHIQRGVQKQILLFLYSETVITMMKTLTFTEIIFQQSPLTTLFFHFCVRCCRPVT